MKRPALLVGAFVIGGLALVVIGVIWLSGNSLFEKQQRTVSYFNGGVAGLYVGAPVTFRGVPVGQVDAINIEVDPKSLAARIRVRMRLSQDSVRLRVPRPEADGSQPRFSELVQRGLRAKLVAQSFVTGQKLIDLDFVPDAAPVVAEAGDVPEIPVVADRFDALVDQVAQVPLRDMVADVRTTLQAVRETLDGARGLIAAAAPEISTTAAEVRKTLQTASATLKAANGTVQHLQTSADATLESVTRLADSSRGVVQGMQPDLQRTLANAREATEAARLAMNQVAELSAPGTPVRDDLQATARDLSQAARSLRELSEVLQQQPNALVFGKRQP